MERNPLTLRAGTEEGITVVPELVGAGATGVGVWLGMVPGGWDIILKLKNQTDVTPEQALMLCKASVNDFKDRVRCLS